MPDFQQLDVTVANRFISSLSKSLQALCHGCMDFDTGIEIVGYINVSIDCGRKVDYVLNERVLKSNTNSMTFVSNSFLAKKEQPKQTRDGACSPVHEISSPARFRSSYPAPHPSTSSFSQSYVLRGSHKRGMEREWRTPKRLRGGRPQHYSPHETVSSGPSSAYPSLSSDSFKMPQSQNTGTISDDPQINIKQEVLENEAEKSDFPGEQGQADNLEQSKDFKSNTESLSAADIKKDPDSSALPGEENLQAEDNIVGGADFKGTFLQPSTSDQSDETALTEKLSIAATKSSASETLEINKPSSSNRIDEGAEDIHAENVASGSDMHLDYEEGDEGNYPQSVYSDAGEGSSDTGQFEVIEIDDEDEDVQAMFAESQEYYRQTKTSLMNRHAGASDPNIQNKGHISITKKCHSSNRDAKADFPASSFQPVNTSTFLRFACQYCAEHFDTKMSLSRHLNENHQGLQGSYPYNCLECGKGFFSYSGRKHHMESHLVNSECPVCGHKFRYSRNLKRHVEISHNMKECRQCKIYISGYDYGNHISSCKGQDKRK